MLWFYFYRINTLETQKKVLENKVQERTVDLKQKARELTAKQEKITHQNAELNEQKEELETTLHSLQETQTQLIQSEKMASLGILTAGIAHEIYNPLNFIQGGNYALNSYLEENLSEHKEEIEPFSDAINLGIERVSTIIESLNHFNRTSEELNEKCDLQLIMNNCLIMISHQTNNHAIIEKLYIDELPTIEGNESEIHQVFINVLINATQAINKNGTIRITFKHSNETVIAEVEDNGYGIAKEDLSKVTVPFYTTKEPGAGTGLGMSIAYTIMNKHKGTIQYDSEPGKGTTVRLHFPR